MRAKTLVEPPGSAASAVCGAGEAVGRLVLGAVATEHGDDVDPVGGRALGRAGWRGLGGSSRPGSPRGRRRAPSG